MSTPHPQQQQQPQPHSDCTSSHAARVHDVAVPVPASGLAPLPFAPQVVAGLKHNTDRIIDHALRVNNDGALKRLTQLCDTFGHRLSGSTALEQAIDWCVDAMKKDQIGDVSTQPCLVPHWVRGTESLTLIKPRPFNLSILGVGNSVGTSKDGITAAVVVVKDYAELKERADRGDVKGKIVLYNNVFTTYGETVAYRSSGASRAAVHGALAVLVRSVCPYSLYTPHTGTLSYDDDLAIPRIPAACITIEDADLLQRFQNSGQDIAVTLKMDALMKGEAPSRNLIAELKGSEFPNEYVVVGGHIDSWDVGQGAHDDAQGCVAAWEILRILKELGIKPKRSIRAVFWTNEENGHKGADAYCNAAMAANAIEQHVAAIESDLGVYTAIGFGFSGSHEARSLMQSLCGTFLSHAAVDACQIKGDGRGVDIRPLIDQGVPGLLLRLHDDWWVKDYWRIHHTNADTIDKIDPAMYRQNVAVLAVMTYLLADMPIRLPRSSKP